MNGEFSRSDIDLSNWRTRPYSRWTFQNASELVPTTIVPGKRTSEAPKLGLGSLATLRVNDVAGEELALPDFLASSGSDSFVVMRGGAFVAEWRAPHCDPAKPHLVFSISKSITGLLAGCLVDEGRLRLDQPIASYVPEARGSAYGDATVDQLLNMNVSLEFDEAYLDTEGVFDRYRRAMLWNPQKIGQPTPDLKSFLCSLPKGRGDHGAQHAYLSPNTDMAGIVLEAASGMRYADLLGHYLWRPLGAVNDAHVTVDRFGRARASAGISMTARDLARLGEMMRGGGAGVAPAEWVRSVWQGGDRALWAVGNQASIFPGGSYRYYWYDTGASALAAIGIHGQWLWIDPKTETIVVRLASEPTPVDEKLDQAMSAVMKAVAAAETPTGENIG